MSMTISINSTQRIEFTGMDEEEKLLLIFIINFHENVFAFDKEHCLHACAALDP
jgi:hypothetical protein